MKLPAVLLLLFFVATAGAQPVCPPNIGFENGRFDHWDMLTGMINGNGTINVSPGEGHHFVYKSEAQPVLDFYGNFPVTAPNGSNYSVQIGQDEPNRKATQLVYAFYVPANTDAYSIIFNYAIVLQNPRHQEHEQPRFTVKVFNETRSEYITCSSFDFVAGFNQPGFSVSPKADSVLFKPWSSVSINLSAFRNERVRLEFTVNDCTRGGHFGYAYFDVMEKCTNNITGNVFCPPVDELTLHAPSGFSAYKWYTGDFSRELADSRSFTVKDPQIGDSFAVELLPFAYLGCRDTFYTKITPGTEPLLLRVKDSVTGCVNRGVDFTDPEITSGSSPGLTYEYFTDSAATLNVTNPKNVTSRGTYYLKATNRSGCVQIKPIVLEISPPTPFGVTDPPLVTYPETVDLTILPDNRQLTYSYWQNSNLTVPVTNPAQVAQSGVYYIAGTDGANCSTVQPVTVKIKPQVYVPTAFTPNGDGLNDRFLYQVQGGLKEVQVFKVFNRWGVEVFSTTTVGKGWDGSFKGKPVESGSFVWMLKGTTWLNNPIVEKGTVVLIR